MSEIAIKAENLGKLYYLGQNAGYSTIRESLTRAASAPFHHSRTAAGTKIKEKDSSLKSVWAIRDVTLEIRPGEVVGFIGRNGAGKTTLLKILSRITTPTEGYAQIWGRVGSLLEVGTGFHPELTGRENIYLNGAILGMTRAEIDRKFAEMVAFSEIEKFLDTPVKRYSSGMYVRLAFSVAAHLDPEILMVDEVLAVGDYKFQEKCLGKMRDVTSQGRTVLFVSHNMKAIAEICTRAILITNGHIEIDGEPATVIRHYTGSGRIDNAEATWTEENAPGNHAVRLLAVRVQDQNGTVKSTFNYTEPINICVTFQVLDDTVDLYLYMYLENEDGLDVLVTNTADNNPRFSKSIHEAKYTIEPHFLNEGRYSVQQVTFKEGMLTSPENIGQVNYPVNFSVSYSGKFTAGMMSKFPGVVRPDWSWSIVSKEN